MYRRVFSGDGSGESSESPKEEEGEKKVPNSLLVVFVVSKVVSHPCIIPLILSVATTMMVEPRASSLMEQLTNMSHKLFDKRLQLFTP